MGMSADDHIDAASVRHECRIAYIFGCFTEGSHMTEAHYNVAFFCTQPVDLFLGNGIRLEVLGRQEVLIGDDTLRVTPEAEDTNLQSALAHNCIGLHDAFECRSREVIVGAYDREFRGLEHCCEGV